MTRLGLALALLLAACGGSSGSTATITITSPAAGSTTTLGTDVNKTVDVGFTATNFKLADTCGGDQNCGHIHVLIDGTDCGSPYNNSATSSPAKALFAMCAHPTGAHGLALELHHEDHSAVKNSSGATISSSVSFTTQ